METKLGLWMLFCLCVLLSLCRGNEKLSYVIIYNQENRTMKIAHYLWRYVSNIFPQF